MKYWCRVKDILCELAEPNGYCKITACKKNIGFKVQTIYHYNPYIYGKVVIKK